MLLSIAEKPTISSPCTLILEELTVTLDAVKDADTVLAEQMILHADRIFVAGAGRSKLALSMAAMRLMHLGLQVHVAGEVTAPAIRHADLLLVASGSGTTPSVLQAAEMARRTGARVLALTAVGDSPLAQRANHVILIPAAAKQDHRGMLSKQYAGALFEQSVLLVLDGMFQEMWRTRGESAEELWKRHANLE